MDFSDAIRAHVEWKVRLRMSLDGQGERIPSEQASRDDACQLGQWIYGEGRFYLDDPAYRELRQVHARFHEAAAQVLAMAEEGNKRGAEAALEGGEYSKCSSAVVAAIMRMRDVAA
jgi:methyl-accepting chemotaxis protein